MVFLLRTFKQVDLIQKDILFGLVIYCFVSMLVSRVGSLILDPVLPALELIRFSDHAAYVVASRSDSLFQALLETCNTFRSIMTVAVCFVSVIVFASRPGKVWLCRRQSKMVNRAWDAWPICIRMDQTIEVSNDWGRSAEWRTIDE